MSFRISVELMICRVRNGSVEVLLVKRAPNSKVAPGVWNVPAGKVNLLETTTQAAAREANEETGLTVEVVKLLCESAFEMKSGEETVYRNMFTYLVKPAHPFQEVILNAEHTEHQWITKEELQSEHFSSLMPRLREILLKGFDEVTVL